jgi:ubiquinol-cytochrome c reductase cytochrome c1 subunit
MKKLIAAVAATVACVLAAPGARAAEGPPIEPWPEARAHDLAALQNGARIFANYCLTCHSANLMRWNRLQDIGLDEAQIRDFLIFGNQKVGDPMTVAMQPKDSKLWFGKAPPDLSVITRARTSFEYKGTDYIYSLLRGYYRDASTPTGWNNIVFPNIGMPHVLWERQGPREVTIERVLHVEDEQTKKTSAVREVSVFDAAGNLKVTKTPLTGHPEESIEISYKPADPAAARQFDSDVADLVAYLAFMTDPSGAKRVRIGVWVLVFLGVFSVLAWWLNREYWKDIK